MQYNIDYLNVKYALVKAFMFNASEDILDISYSCTGTKIEIQVVLLGSCFLSEQMRERVEENLPEFDINITELHISKEQFNENIGDWTPIYYEWLEEVILSKAEVL